jgi:hypothetical protein
MYAMFGDEVLAEESAGRNFFIYGGVFIDVDELPAIHEKIERLRRDAGFGAGDSLKFSAKGRPGALSPEEHRDIKSAVIALAEEYGVTFCAYLVLQAIAKVQQTDNIVHWGCNTLLARYNQFLLERDDHGVGVLDRFSGNAHNAFNYAKVKFQRGLTFGRNPDTRLDRVLGIGFTCDGAAHMSSVADIVLGAFGYCISEGINTEAAQTMFPALVRLMWKRTRNGQTTAIESGFNLRPKTEEMKSLRYKEMYVELMERLNRYVAGSAPNAAQVWRA